MPVYEYECLKCGDRFEEIRRLSDAPLQKHTGCGGRVKRLPSAPAIQFKGTGFYITDYARKNSGSSGDGKKEGSETKPETKSEAKSESKPADTTKKTM